MIQNVHPFLNFDGKANEAIELYKSALGATLQDYLTWSKGMAGGDVPAEIANNVMYAKLTFSGGAIELSDMPPGMSAAPGTNMHVILHVDEPGDVDRIFAALADGGEVVMPVENTFWGARYGRLIDRFGIGWALHCQIETPQ